MQNVRLIDTHERRMKQRCNELQTMQEDALASFRRYARKTEIRGGSGVQIDHAMNGKSAKQEGLDFIPLPRRHRSSIAR